MLFFFVHLFNDLLSLLFLFGVRCGHSGQLLFDLLYSLEGEIILGLIFQLLDVVLDVELGEVSTAVDHLIVHSLFEFVVFGLLPDLDAEWLVRRLNDITPEASHHDVVPRFFLKEVRQRLDLHLYQEYMSQMFGWEPCFPPVLSQRPCPQVATACSLAKRPKCSRL